jgi:retron-type reverse transcriptase
VFDLDIKSFFEGIDWELLLRAVRRHTGCEWGLPYIDRWLKALAHLSDGTLRSRENGMAQGAASSPLTQKVILRIWGTPGVPRGGWCAAGWGR